MTLLDDGADVLEYLKSSPDTDDIPHLVFMDLNMPKVCGRTTTNIIRSDKRYAHLPIVILSTSSDGEEKKKMLSLGANAFYSKPSSIGEIKKIVISVLHTILGPDFSRKLEVA